MRIEFDCNDDWHVWIDGEEIGNGYSWQTGDPDYINFIENIISPSCPLNVISTINLEKELYIREIGKNREVTDEW